MHFGETFEPAPLGLLNEFLARFVAFEGTADMIIDVSTSRATAAARPVIERGLSRSHMPDRRRVFVVADDVQYGLIRMYGVYQETIGMPAPMIVRSLSHAMEVLQCGQATFEPWALSDAADSGA